MRAFNVLAVLAACAGLSVAQNQTIIPWMERPATGYAPLNLSCSDVARFKWGAEKHVVYNTRGIGCKAPIIDGYYEGPNGDVPIYFSYPGTYNYICDVNDHCTKGRQKIEITVGQCGAPNVLAWSFRRDNSTYAPVTVPCGTNVTFAWPSGRHDVVQVAKPDCGSTVVKSYGEPAAGPSSTTVEFGEPGVFHYLCGAPNHCALGSMLVTVFVQPSAACGTPPPFPPYPPPPMTKPNLRPPNKAPARRPPARRPPHKPKIHLGPKVHLGPKFHLPPKH